VRSEPSAENLKAATRDRLGLQDPRLLRVGLDGDVAARPGLDGRRPGGWTSPTRAPGGVLKVVHDERGSNAHMPAAVGGSSSARR